MTSRSWQQLVDQLYLGVVLMSCSLMHIDVVGGAIGRWDLLCIRVIGFSRLALATWHPVPVLIERCRMLWGWGLGGEVL